MNSSSKNLCTAAIGRVLALPRSAPVPGRSNGIAAERWVVTNDFPATLRCCARDGRTPKTGSAVALANSIAGSPPAEVGLWTLDNTLAVAEDGWCLIAPFGEWPKTRVYREAGRVHEQRFLQVLDDAAADALLAKENSLFGRLKRAFIGVPVYKGHGDLADVDPQAISGGGEKIKLGVVDQIRKTARGLEAHFALDADGAAAVAAGWKFPSSFWYVRPIENAARPEPRAPGLAETIRCRPFKLISVALTPFPNISGVESLANARTEKVAAGVPPAVDSGILPPVTPLTTLPNHEPPPTTNPQPSDMKLITGWLLAQGAALANAENPSETQLLEALQHLHTTTAASVAALGNERQTLSDRLTALETERDQFRQQATDTATALTNEKSARYAERQGRAEAVTDLAIQRGKATVAQRDTHITTLANSPDFELAARGLLNGVTVVKTAGQEVQSGKQNAGLPNEQQQLQNEYNQAFQAELIATGQNPARAHNNIMTLPKYAGLAAKLLPKQF